MHTLQVRDLDRLSTAEGTTTRELRDKLRTVADDFVRPESATEVNVKGSTRKDVLNSIEEALEAGKQGGGVEPGGDEWARVLAIAATEALVNLAREVHSLIFDGIWPRFLLSREFTLMMTTEVCTATYKSNFVLFVAVQCLPALFVNKRCVFSQIFRYF